MRTRFVIAVSLKQLQSNLKSTLVVILCLTICVASVFLMAESLLYSNNFLQDIEINRRTYSVNMSGGSENPAKTYTVYNEVIYGDTLPEISSITGIYANPDIDENVEDYISAAVYFENDPRYSVELDLIDGRGFTAEELAAGSNVIIISTDLNYWKAKDPYEVGDTVLVNNTPYEVIGIDSYSSYITEQNVLNNRNFYIYFDGIQFSQRLSTDDEQLFMELFTSVNGSPTSRFSQLLTEFTIHVATYICLIGLVSYCAFSIIAQLFNYMVKSRQYEYNIYKVLGIKHSLLFAVYYTPILLLSILSGFLGIVLYRYSEPLQCYIGMENTLTPGISGICYLVIGIVLLLATMPNYMKLKRQSALETR